MKNFMKFISAIFVILFLIVAAPFILILGLNLLGFELPYNFTSWAGSFLVTLALRSPSRSKD